MMSHHQRRILPSGGTRKRKEREALCYSGPLVPPTPSATTEAGELMSSNRLLAGYMAHEFLTKGTLLGQKFHPARAEAVPLGSSTSSSSAEQTNIRKEHHSYAEVASIVKADGTHIPGVVNPTQLSRWIQM